MPQVRSEGLGVEAAARSVDGGRRQDEVAHSVANRTPASQALSSQQLPTDTLLPLHHAASKSVRDPEAFHFRGTLPGEDINEVEASRVVCLERKSGLLRTTGRCCHCCPFVSNSYALWPAGLPLLHRNASAGFVPSLSANSGHCTHLSKPVSRTNMRLAILHGQALEIGQTRHSA